MIRGEYELSDGTIIPNQFTIYGMGLLLRAAFWDERPDWFMGLCARNPGDVVTMDSLLEPTAGVNGYDRQRLPLNKNSWNRMGVINGETYVESLVVTFPIVAPLDSFTNRLFLTDGEQVISISSALPGGLKQLSAPYLQKYRLFFR